MKRMRCPGCSRHCSADNLKCRRGRAYFEKKIAEEKAQDGPKYKWERYVTQGSAVKELLTAAAMATLPTIEGANATGYTSISLAANVKTMIAVTYQACDASGSVSATDLVSTNGLTSVSDSASADSAARLYVLTSGTTAPVYQVYYLDTEDGWTPVSGSVATMTAGDAAFLVNPTAVTAYTKGGVVSTQSTECTVGYNLVGSTSTESYTLGSLTFTTPNGGALMRSGADKIILQDGTTYWRYSDGTTSEWRTKSNTTADLTTVTLSAGTGFWYVVATGGNSVTISR